jgi:nucleoside-diphosphate kinase
MTENVLVVIKPEGISRGLVGKILDKFSETKLTLVALKILKPNRGMIEEHYKHIKGQPFYADVVRHMLGEFHKQKKVIAMIYQGAGAIKVCRKLCGATNPQEAEASSIRGMFGKVTDEGLYENIVHVSSSLDESEREIKLWFFPEEILSHLYKTKIKTITAYKKEVWA